MMHSEINVTPLVDICLVLLIIFMVVLPEMVNGVEVKLPETKTGDALENRVFPVTVKEDGTVYLDTLVVRRDEVERALERLRASAAARPVAVRGDKRVAYGEVMGVVSAVRTAGWQEVTLVGTTTPPAPAVDAMRP